MQLNLQWVALCTIVRKEVKRFTRIWVQTLIPPLVTMSLYFIVFGKLIGERIGEISGYSYMAFVVPGLIIMSVINNAYSNVVSSFFSAKLNRSVEEILVSPTPNHVILWGYVSGGAIRGLLVGALVTLLALLFTRLPLHNIAVTFTVVFLSALLFALAGFINAIFANSFDDISIVPNFIITPLTYFGGVFYSVDLLPGFWQNLSYFNPILYIVNAFRYGFLGISDVNVYASLAGIIAFLVLLYGFAWYLLVTAHKLRN